MLLRLGVLIVVLGGLVSVFSMSCGVVPESTEIYSENFTLEENALVTVRNTSGDISIVTWGKEYVEVNATKKTTWGKSELDKVEVRVTTTPGNMVVETAIVQKNARVSVQYDIKLPRNVIMNSVEVENGDIHLEDTNGSTIVTTSLGSIRIKNTSGYLTATADSGKIELEGTTGGAKLVTSNSGIYVNKADGDISATASNGAIEVRDSKGDVTLDTSNGHISVTDLDGFVVRARTSNGPIDVHGAGGVQMAETTNGNIDIELSNVREEGATIRTTNGSIVLYLSPDLNAEIELKAGAGEWSSQTVMQIVTSGRTYMSGILGAGGAKIYVETTNGDIELKRLDV
jgi:DUF4097 and DUF4098 domain-containing protein YvlB